MPTQVLECLSISAIRTPPVYESFESPHRGSLQVSGWFRIIPRRIPPSAKRIDVVCHAGLSYVVFLDIV